jgi:predicted amino acid-binding ACT domain protein
MHYSACSSAKGQTDPRLDNQLKIIPSDQVGSGKAALQSRARREEFRGRPDAAARYRTTADEITDRISLEGVESSPLTKRNVDNLGKAIITDNDGSISVDMDKIETVLEEIGIKKKMRSAVARNRVHIKKHNADIARIYKDRVRAELRGALTAIGMATVMAGGITIASSLIEHGVNVETVKQAVLAGTQTGAEGGMVAAGVYSITRTAGPELIRSVSNLLAYAGVEITKNLAAGVSLGVMGIVATAGVACYSLAKAKVQGASVKEALFVTGKSAGLSLEVTAAAAVATIAFGPVGGMLVSTVAGVASVVSTLFRSWRNRQKTVCCHASDAGTTPVYA